MGFLRGEHRILVRQINTAHASGSEFSTHGLRFLAIADEDRDVRGHQAFEFVVAQEARSTLLSTVEQCCDFTGTRRGQLLAVHRTGQGLFGRQVPDIQRRDGLMVDLQNFFAPLRIDRQERDRVITVFLAKQESSASGLATLGIFKYMVHGIDHAVTGTEVGAQCMQAPGGCLTGA
ncbi:hypothetical protein D3C81_1459200 [compost metagenome]